MGKSDIRVEIVCLLPGCASSMAADFTTVSQQPNNPLLELKVYLPGKGKPLREIAFAKNPMLSLAKIHGWNCPVKFWYHHPAVLPEAGTQFLQTPDGKLHYRVVADGKMRLARRGEGRAAGFEPPTNSAFPSSSTFRTPARDQLPPVSRDRTTNAAAPEPAVLVRVEAGGESQEVWLKRADPEYGYRQINTPEGPLGIAYGYETLPLGFSLKLVEFRHEMNPGMMGDASFASSVRVIDKAHNVDQARRDRHESAARLRRVHVLPIQLRSCRRRQERVGSHGRL